ncbi:Nucleotide-binding universal stress protein, UspA family [Thermomonospora echinospora]|uniref:Nucleotide-binding universal stress protein, UspA family n=1 Tax=Thermomonospora echinospora TaxID=1992 RepID=A0A1H6BY86_9ACTN|nr:universal stress protein [Thermomonospora echinospora]SEG65661.1 Nucleotide-binding universal stress protein, UspA family [Thermomonospora echinospora]
MTETPAAAPRVIVGVDESETARWALSWALGEARLRGMELLVVHVAPVPPYAAAAGVPGHGAACGLREAGGELITRLLAELQEGGGCGATRVSGMTLLGAPGDALVRLAREEDILVVGRGTRGPLSRLLRPSVHRHCAAHARATLVCVAPPTIGRLTVPGAAQERPLRRRPWWRRHEQDHTGG